MSDEQKWFTPEGGVGPQELKHRRESALGILQQRGIHFEPNPALAAIRAGALIKILVAKGIIESREEFDYYARLYELESIEDLVLASAPKPKIHLLGRDA